MEYILHGLRQVPGWLTELDAFVFAAIDDSQHEAGITGDILEIGAWRGRSAILLGYLLRPTERLVVCDFFEGELREDFERNYRRFHGKPPYEVVTSPSTSLGDRGYERKFRLVHIDGDHTYEGVRSDLLLSRRLLTDGGFVAFDDVNNLHYPAVAAAVWEAVTIEGLVPQIVTDKLYASWSPVAPVSFGLMKGHAVDVRAYRGEVKWETAELMGMPVAHPGWVPLEPTVAQASSRGPRPFLRRLRRLVPRR